MSQDKIKRQKMPAQDAQERINNFEEVALGYTLDEALKESLRCLECENDKCRQGCPVNIDIRGFIKAIKEKDFRKGYAIVKKNNNLPGICGRVCPQEGLCEKQCIRGINDDPVAIGRLERFLADWALNNKMEQTQLKSSEKKDDKVAIIGSGPAGLVCAAELAKAGFKVSVFESLHKSGGVLRYGIPEFRLPKKILDNEVALIKKLGVEINLNVLVGKTKTLEELRQEGFKAFFIATGAGLPFFLGIPGENLNGVYSANEFLTRINLMKAYKFPEYDTPVDVGAHVCVVGAGNVAFDAARSAVRLGAKKVTIVYRRGEKEMPARLEEINHAKEEGISFSLLTSPLEIIADERGWVKSMRCIRNELGEEDSSGRRRPVPIQGTEFYIQTQTVICAIGQGPNPLLLRSIPGLKLNDRGNVMVDDKLMSNIDGVFAGGDIVSGSATVIEAMRAGKRAAFSISNYLLKG